MKQWHSNSWQQKPYAQKVVYPDQRALDEAVAELSQLPPLVTPLEISALKQNLVQAAQGKAFLLQGGDCAENFSDCNEQTITTKLKIMLQMSLVLIYGLRKPVIRVGRIAGQYAKPRSADMEIRGDITLPSYRGDIINGPAFTAADRLPEPKRMVQGYCYAALTLNYLRALIDSGFADLQTPENWDLGFVPHSPYAKEYQRIVREMGDAVDFMRTVSGIQSSSLRRVDLYTSHEALHLHFEQALTRQVGNRWYNLATHYPWVGMRTADINGAHIEYLRGIDNPVAVKIGPDTTPAALLALIDTLNPLNEAGKLTLIHRLGVHKIEQLLPPLIKAVLDVGKTVVWCCDPMHGNTATTREGIKTRRFDDIILELQHAFRLHGKLGSHLGGVHFEMTGEDVTECVGGARGLTEDDLKRAYKSLVDPRLNYDQALEMALRISGGSRDVSGNRCGVN